MSGKEKERKEIMLLKVRKGSDKERKRCEEGQEEREEERKEKERRG